METDRDALSSLLMLASANVRSDEMDVRVGPKFDFQFFFLISFMMFLLSLLGP
jgi:hypothetical protein